MKFILIILSIVFLSGCNSEIKDEDIQKTIVEDVYKSNYALIQSNLVKNDDGSIKTFQKEIVVVRRAINNRLESTGNSGGASLQSHPEFEVAYTYNQELQDKYIDESEEGDGSSFLMYKSVNPRPYGGPKDAIMMVHFDPKGKLKESTVFLVIDYAIPYTLIHLIPE